MNHRSGGVRIAATCLASAAMALIGLSPGAEARITDITITTPPNTPAFGGASRCSSVTATPPGPMPTTWPP